MTYASSSAYHRPSPAEGHYGLKMVVQSQALTNSEWGQHLREGIQNEGNNPPLHLVIRRPRDGAARNRIPVGEDRWLCPRYGGYAERHHDDGDVEKHWWQGNDSQK